MMNEIGLCGPRRPVRIGIVAARFNHFVTGLLLEGALDAFRRNGISDERITLAWVPGAYELPLAADRMLASGYAEGVLALGAVIRGGTPHFDYVAGACSHGLAEVALRHGRPVSFGVLTTDTVEQALERATPGAGNKGFDVAQALLHMLGLVESLASSEIFPAPSSQAAPGATDV